MFDKFHKHCTECKKGQPCGKFHLYVLSLDPRIRTGSSSKKRRFRRVNPNTHATGTPVYVGKSECAPRCRQGKHRTYVDADTSKWRCYCGKYDELNEYIQFCDTPTSVRNYLKGDYGFLIPGLLKQLNPFETSQAAEEAEGALAIALRDAGYAVWAGHHDDALVAEEGDE